MPRYSPAQRASTALHFTRLRPTRCFPCSLAPLFPILLSPTSHHQAFSAEQIAILLTSPTANCVDPPLLPLLPSTSSFHPDQDAATDWSINRDVSLTACTLDTTPIVSPPRITPDKETKPQDKGPREQHPCHSPTNAQALSKTTPCQQRPCQPPKTRCFLS